MLFLCICTSEAQNLSQKHTFYVEYQIIIVSSANPSLTSPLSNKGPLLVILAALYHDFQSYICLSSMLDCLPPGAHYKEHLAQRLALNI